VIDKYNDLMESDEMKEASKWRRDSPLKREWDESDWELFEKLYKGKKWEIINVEYPDGPHSNRTIAQKMGKHDHPNHIAHYKVIYKKKMNKK
jgi:hypothetical protein